MMSTKVKLFNEIKREEQILAGGKGGTLARLYQKGYPVPPGFVIFPDAFEGEALTREGWADIQACLARMRQSVAEMPFAVRSSALSEDSAHASFAGEFETVLEVHSDEMIREAIRTVHGSRRSERVRAYSAAKGMAQVQPIAVVVQEQVRAEISGILFTANPVTGSQLQMSGNYIYGLGDELVSGEVEPYTFTLSRPDGRYDGPAALRPFAKRLFKMAARLEKDLGLPQDIEWCMAGGALYLLQSRPITTLSGFDARTALWNASLEGDYLWFRHEVFPDVLTPASWSIWQLFQQWQVAGVPGIGNIGGRMYMNYSFVRAIMMAFGSSEADIHDQMVLTAAAVPPGITVPDVPVTRWGFIKTMLPIMWELLPRQIRLRRHFNQIISSTPAQCAAQRRQIAQIDDPAVLIDLWHAEIEPSFTDLLQLQDKLNEDYFNPYKALKKTLSQELGEERALQVLALLSGDSDQLASMGPIIGLARLDRGEISREEYAQQAGHRPAHENELAEPRPDEDPHWLERRLADYEATPVDVEAMAHKRAEEFENTWQEVAEAFPRRARGLRKRVDQIREATQARELIRSELTRYLRVIRDWFLRAAALCGVDQGDIFYLTYAETLDVLAGNTQTLAYLPARREMYDRLRALPPYPTLISGRFDPFQWAADPARRSDLYDSHAPLPVAETGAIAGYPGSSGRAVGIVRHLASPEQGPQLREGEILLAATTNVGWTPIFPRAAAVITDIGAPLSHAAIVARELGIPAVVGTGNATMRLRSGDRVLVDGGRGIVHLLEAA